MDFVELVAVARLKSCLQDNRYRVTLRGDGLGSLDPPTDIWLYQPQKPTNNLKEILKIAIGGLEADGMLWTTRLAKIWGQTVGNAYVELELASLKAADGKATAELPFRGQGLWLCVPRARLIASSKEPYLFQILGLEVLSQGRKVATVVDYFETDAHGILVAVLPEGKKVLLPYVEEHVQWDTALRHVEVPYFSSFVDRGVS